MNTFLLVLGVLGIGAVVIAAYVFTVAARNYVSEGHEKYNATAEDEEFLYIVRSPYDRRQGDTDTGTDFPLKLSSGDVIPFDRRAMTDRRMQAV